MVADIVYLGPCDKYPSARSQKLCCFAQECPYSQHGREFPNILLPNSCSREGTTTLKLALRRVDASL